MKTHAIASLFFPLKKKKHDVHILPSFKNIPLKMLKSRWNNFSQTDFYLDCTIEQYVIIFKVLTLSLKPILSLRDYWNS